MKNNKVLITAYIVLILFLSTICFAEFYKYKDSNGYLRFTDNLAEVPEDQRPKADKYKEYVPKKPDTNAELNKAIQATEKQSNQKLPDAATQPKEIQIQNLGNKISKIQEDLQKEYQQLIAKKKAIEVLDQKAGPKKAAQMQLLKEQAEQLNKDIKAYNQKKEICIKAIKEYQRKIQMLSAKGIEQP